MLPGWKSHCSRIIEGEVEANSASNDFMRGARGKRFDCGPFGRAVSKKDRDQKGPEDAGSSQQPAIPPSELNVTWGVWCPGTG